MLKLVKYLWDGKKGDIKTVKPFLKKNKKGDLELDELGKLILGVILLIILIVIVTIFIKGELWTQGDSIKDSLNFFD